MASGHVNRAERPNTRAHRRMLHTCKKSLPNRSRPHTEVKRSGTASAVGRSLHLRGAQF
jgi:hypothetical protein